MLTDILRLLGGICFVGLASLTLLPPPTRFLWVASVAATEWGYWLAFAALLPVIPTRTQTAAGRLGAMLSLCAIGLFVTPVVRARETGRALPSAFDSRFGPERRERAEYAAESRREPLVIGELLRPAELPAIRFDERVFTADDGQKLPIDVYRPGYVHGPLPGIIVIHGGMWQSGDTSEFVALNAYLAARDMIVAAINYRLAPQWPFPAARNDVRAAVAYLKANAEELGLDPTRIALLGRGAGGQLALLAAYTANDPSIRGVISLYGHTDLKFEYDNPASPGVLDTRRVLETYLGGPPATTDNVYFAASPVNFVSEKSPPTLLIHGLKDPIAPPDGSAKLENQLRLSGVKHLFVRLPWATHGCDKSFGGPCGQIATYSVERFLDAVLMAPPTPRVPDRRGSRSAQGRSTKSRDAKTARTSSR